MISVWLNQLHFIYENDDKKWKLEMLIYRGVCLAHMVLCISVAYHPRLHSSSSARRVRSNRSAEPGIGPPSSCTTQNTVCPRWCAAMPQLATSLLSIAYRNDCIESNSKVVTRWYLNSLQELLKKRRVDENNIREMWIFCRYDSTRLQKRHCNFDD